MATNVAQATATTNQQQQQTRNGNSELETLSSPSKQQAATTRIDNPRPALADISNVNGVAGAADVIVVYDVEHLATFSTAAGSHETNNSRSKQVNNDDSKSSSSSSSKLPSAGAAVCSDDDDDDPSARRRHLRTSGPAKASAAQFDGCGITTPRVALRRLFELEKLSGIWTQRMQIELRTESMLIVDCETESVVEKFDKSSVTKPEAFNEYNHIYNNIVVFIISQKSKQEEEGEGEGEEGELHIFQCVSQQAQQLVQDIQDWKASKLQAKVRRSSESSLARTTSNNNNNKSQEREEEEAMAAKLIINSSGISSKYQDKVRGASSSDCSKQLLKKQTSESKAAAATKPVVTVASSSSGNENVPVVNVNVKETVQVFNQIAALREKSKPASPTNGNNHLQSRPLSDASAASSNNSSTGQNNNNNNKQQEEAAGQLESLESTSFFKQRSIRAKLSGQDNQKSRSDSTTTASCSSSSLAAAAAATAAVEQTKPLSSSLQQVVSGGGDTKMMTNSGSTSSSSTNNACSSTSTSSQASSSQRSASSGFNPHHSHQHQHHSSHPHPQQTHSSSKHNHSHHQAATTAASNGHATVSNQPSSSTSTSKTKSSTTSSGRAASASAGRTSHLDQVTTNESYVSVLNHCFDDIEKFILKLQQAMAASRELQQAKRKLSKRSSSIQQDSSQAGGGAAAGLTASEMALLGSRARGPNEEDYFEILSKFKLAFNLLAKLKGCIHEPNAPELVHFLFTPLAIIIESARNAKPAIDPTLVGIPYLNQDALDLLSNCCTSKEYDMWMSLGPNWIQTIDSNLLKASRLPSSFQPIFSDGWAPIIGELELIGLVVPPSHSPHDAYLRSQDELTAIDATADQSPPQAERQHRHRHKQHDHHHQQQQQQQQRPRHPSAGGYADISPPLAANGQKSSSSSRRNLHHAPVSRHLSEPAVAAAANYGHEPYNNYANPTIDPLNGTTSPYLSSREIYHRPVLNHPANHLHHRPSGSSNRSGSVERARPHQMRMGPGALNRGQSKSSTTRVDDLYPQRRMAPPLPLGHDDLLDPHPHHRPAADHHLPQYMMPPDRYAATKDLAAAPMKSYHHHKQRHLYDGYPAPEEESGDFFGSHHPDEDDLQLHSHPADRHQQHEAMLLDLGPAQLDWFYELQSRGAMIVRVLFSRAANNDKELSVRRGEILEILDDSRKWWRARNIDLQVAHVPHTIVAPMQGYQTLDDLLANNPTDMIGGGSEDPSFMLTSASSASMHYARHPVADDWHLAGSRNSKNAGAFRYF